MSTIYKISEKQPEFVNDKTTWVWYEEAREWDEIESASQYFSKYDTHWCHSDTRPTIDPTAQPAPSNATTAPAQVEKSPGHTYEEWKEYQELERLLDDTATLCRRLVRALGKEHPLYQTASDFLRDNDLIGTPLRETSKPSKFEESASAPATTAENGAIFAANGRIFFSERGKLHPESIRYIYLDSGRHAHLIFAWSHHDIGTGKEVYRLSNIQTGEMS